MKLIIFISVLAFLTSCSTIHFDNGEINPSPSLVTSKWHHNAIYGLIEVSSPVNLKQVCRNRTWSSVKTEVSAANALVLMFMANVTGPIWSPSTVTIACQ